jgi:hypothetical protein
MFFNPTDFFLSPLSSPSLSHQTSRETGISPNYRASKSQSISTNTTQQIRASNLEHLHTKKEKKKKEKKKIPLVKKILQVATINFHI